jgi:2-oxoglutarate ferredoxin oxidoreductase subunit beta
LEDTPMGVFRDVNHLSYDVQARAQVAAAQASKPVDLARLIQGSDTWQVG